MVIIGVLLLLVLFGGMVGAVMYVMKKTDPKNVDSSLRDDISTAQEYLPFVDIRDSMIMMGNHDYRAVLEVSSINYDLKSAKEKDIIEMSYTRFLNSLTFDITIFIATREIDNTSFLELMNEDYSRSVQEYPELREYAEQNLRDMAELNDYLGVTRQKKKYVIISYNEANALSMQNDQEKYDHSMKEVATRARIIQEGLSAVGLSSQLLKTPDILDLVVRTYHRSGKSHANEIWSKEYTNMIVEGEAVSTENNLTDGEHLDLILKEMEERLHTSILSNQDATQSTKEHAQYAYELVRNLRRDETLDGLKENIQEDYYRQFENNIVGVKKNEAKKQKPATSVVDEEYDQF